MTAADLLAKMNVLANGLDISSGGADESRALAALDMAQDGFESAIATIQDLLNVVSTITTTASQEYTTWPSTLLRLDTMWLLDANSRQRWEIDLVQKVGGQTATAWPLSLAVSVGSGAPQKAYTNRAAIYWDRLPDAVYTLRLYGLSSATNLTTRAITFGYPDAVSLPMAAMATQLMQLGINDPTAELEALSDKYYGPVIKMLSQPVRQRAQSRQYAEVHST